MPNTELTGKLIGIARHRMAVDGEGVTTLVAFHGCPLRWAALAKRFLFELSVQSA